MTVRTSPQQWSLTELLETGAERFNPSLAEMKHKKGSALSDSRHAHQASFLESTRVQRCLSASDIIAAAPAGVVQLWVSQGKLPW